MLIYLWNSLDLIFFFNISLESRENQELTKALVMVSFSLIAIILSIYKYYNPNPNNNDNRPKDGKEIAYFFDKKVWEESKWSKLRFKELVEGVGGLENYQKLYKFRNYDEWLEVGVNLENLVDDIEKSKNEVRFEKIPGDNNKLNQEYHIHEVDKITRVVNELVEDQAVDQFWKEIQDFQNKKNS